MFIIFIEGTLWKGVFLDSINGRNLKQFRIPAACRCASAEPMHSKFILDNT
jgi:hypothetical protein